MEAWKHRVEIVIAEIGFCTDTRYKEKLMEKTWQHRHMVSRLVARGWTVTQAEVVIGNAGTMYTKSVEALRHTLQISSQRVTKLAVKLGAAAIQHTKLAIVARRSLDVG